MANRRSQPSIWNRARKRIAHTVCVCGLPLLDIHSWKYAVWLFCSRRVFSTTGHCRHLQQPTQKLLGPNLTKCQTKCKSNQTPSKAQNILFLWPDHYANDFNKIRKCTQIDGIVEAQRSQRPSAWNDDEQIYSSAPLRSAGFVSFFFSVAPPSAAATAAVSDRRKLKKEQIMAAVIFSVADAQQAKINDAVPVTWPR